MAVLSTLARGAHMLIVAAMIVPWAISASKSNRTEPKNEQVIERWYA
jgi:hypothetical protein